MSTNITLNSEQVLGIASRIEDDNNELGRLLARSKSVIDNLANTWTGQAAETTRSAYSGFATQYFQSYHDVLEQYVKFLRRNVAEQYVEVETKNMQLGDQFK